MTGGALNVLVMFDGYGAEQAGAERMVLGAMAGLTRRGHTVVGVVPVPGMPVAAGTRVFGSVDELSAALPRWRPDVVHLFDLARPALAGTAAAWSDRHGVPLALTPCSAPGVWPDPGRAREACLRADLVFALTPAETRSVHGLGVPPHRIRPVASASDLHGTADADRFRDAYGLDGPVVLFLGRRAVFKGYRVLLEAMERVWRDLPATHFVFIGSDADPEAPEVFARHADPRLHDLGVTDEQTKHDALAASALLCLPTRADVFPLVFIEAWACGRPVISGEYPGVRDVVRHGCDGLIVEPAPGPVAGALIALLRDEPERARMGREARRRFERDFGWDRVAGDYEAGYREALRNGREVRG